LPGGRLAWAANGAALEVLCCRTGARRAAWTFGAHCSDGAPPQVTAVCSVAEAVGPAAAHLLAVGLDCGGRSDSAGATGGGMVCVFDLSAAAVVRAVRLPHQVTALHVLRAPTDSVDLCPPLQAMGVLAAVGTQAGFVLLLDLCLDGPVDTDERSPGVPTYVTVLEPAAAQRRHEQAALGNHLCLPLNDAAVEGGMYQHRSAAGRLEHAQPADDTWVSTVHWLPQLRSLVVGLSFGCFQVWSLETLQLEFASRYEAGQLPVVGCVFLEPENDPRRFVYLWVINSVPAYHDMNGSVASAALYALLYTERSWEEGIPVYRGLQQAGRKLVYDLTTTPEQPDAGRVSASCLLSAFALPAAGLESSGGGDDSLAPRDGTCCALAWEAWTEDGASACTCLALFDLNRWYQAQLPHRVDAAGLERCEYLRFFSLDASDGIVMGVSVRAAEPRSGLLTATLLLDVGVQTMSFCGPQEQLLRALQATGGAQLSQPLQAYEAARRLGLVSAGAVSPAEQREALLTLALERGFSSLLASCATRWSSGDSDPGGCTLRALLNWLWQHAVEVVSRIDASCVPLFDMSAGNLSDEDLAILHGLRAQLDGMVTVLDTMAARTPNTDGGRAELESKSYVLRVRSLHTGVILWLCHAGLLPEQADEEAGESVEFAYPGAALAQWYAERRRQLGRRLLMVDGLVEELGEPLRAYWQEDGDGAYPPRSLQALTRAYLLDGVTDVRKHRLLHYLLLDLSRLVSDEHHDTLKSFPSSFAMPPSLIKLTHAFWHLDHGNVDSALVFLMDPLVRPADLSAWQHRRVVESLLAQQAPRAALQYARARHLPAPHAADLRLHLRVLLDNGLVTEALRYERRHRPLGGDELTGWLLEGCKQRRLLTQLMRQPLDAALERQFIQFLEKNADRECAELLHVFYLQRGRYREAGDLQRRLAAAAAPPAPARAEFRQSLHQLLPTLIHRRDGSPSAGVPRHGTVASRRRPLSAQLHQVPADVRSRAILIQEVLEQNGKKPATPAVAATPFRPRHKRKLPEDDDVFDSPAAGQRRPLRPDVRRLLQTPPVRRAPRRSDIEPGTPQMTTPAATRTPQSILKVRRYLESSGASRTEDTPSKQLRFGMLRGRRSLEESRADHTPPPLATLFTPGKTPAPLRAPVLSSASPVAPEHSQTPSTPAPVRLASLFTPGKTPAPLAPRISRLPEPRIAMAEVLTAAERKPPTPEPASPPSKRQSLASELDDSEFYSFEASPTVAEQTLEFFGRERQLQLVERSWHDESDVVTMGGDVSRRSHTGDDDETMSEGSPAHEDEVGQRHSTPQQELQRRTVGDQEHEEAVDPRAELHLVTPSPRRELHRSARAAVCDTEELGDRSGVREERSEVSAVIRTEVSPVSARATEPTALLEKSEQNQIVSEEDQKSVASENESEAAAPEEEPAMSEKDEGEPVTPSEDNKTPAASSQKSERRESNSSGEFSPLIGNKFTSLAALADAEPAEGGLEALEAQILTGADNSPQRAKPSPEKSPEKISAGAAGEEPLVVKRTAWVTGEESETQDRTLSSLEAQILTGPGAVSAGKETAGRESPAPEVTSGAEPLAVREAAWVTGTPESDLLDRRLAELEAQVVSGGDQVNTGSTESHRRSIPDEQSAVERRTAWVTGVPDDDEETSPMSESYLAPPAGLQEALQRIDQALQLPDLSTTIGPTAITSGVLSNSSEAVSSMTLRLESDSEDEQEPPQFAGFTSLQQGPAEPAAPSPPRSPPADRLTRSSLLRRPSPAAGSPLLTPRRSLRRRAGSGAAEQITEKTTETDVETQAAVETTKAVVESTETIVKTTEMAVEATEERTVETTEKITVETTESAVDSTNTAVETAKTRVVTSETVETTETVTEPTEAAVEIAETTAMVTTKTVETAETVETMETTVETVETADDATETAAESTEEAVESTEAAVETTAVVATTVETTETVVETVETVVEAMETAIESTTTAVETKEAAIETTEAAVKSKETESTEAAVEPAAEVDGAGSEPVVPAAAAGTPSSQEVGSAEEDTTPSPKTRRAIPSPKKEKAVTRSPEKAGQSTSPVVKITTPTSSPPTRQAAAAAARAEVSSLSPVAEEHPSEAPPSPPTDSAAALTTPSRARRSVRRSVGGVTPRSRLSLLAAVDPLSPVPEGRSVGAASGEPAEPDTAAATEEQEGETEEPLPEPTSTRKSARRSASAEPEQAPTSMRKSSRRSASAEPEQAPTSARKSSRSRAGSVGPATPLRRSARTRSVSQEPEEAGAETDSLRGGSVEPGSPVSTPSRRLRTRQVSEEPEQATAPATSRGRRTRKASQSEHGDDSVFEDTTKKGAATRDGSEEPKDKAGPDTTVKTRRARKVSEEPEEPTAQSTAQKTRRTRKASEEPEEQSVLDTAKKTRRTRKTSEEPEEASVLDTAKKTRRTRKASEEPEEASVLDTAKKTRRTRKASEEPEETSVLDTAKKTRRTRKASEGPEEPSVLDTAKKTRRTRKASEEPEEPSVLDTAKKTRRSRKTSESQGEQTAADTTQSGRRTRKVSESTAAEEPTPARATRTRKMSESSEADVPVPPSASKRTRKQSQASESSEAGGSPERASKARRLRGSSEDVEDDEDDGMAPPASPARSTRARSLSVQPSSPARLPTRAVSEQPPETRVTASGRKRRPAKGSEPATPPTAAKTGRGTKKSRAAAAADEDEDPPSDGEQSPPVRRAVGRRSQAGATARRSALPAIAEAAAEAMPPPAGAAAGRRRRRRTTRLPSEPQEAGSPLVLVTEEQLEEIQRRSEDSPEQEPLPRDRRASIARTRQRTGPRRSVRLW
ncbi:protein ELYS-like, partial [Amphibalanus amphitrite]|uniref:protein ELYS-like n=1 Tax=Amphibalanus amphitrite TaxID=1232801 RepID=UPI001C907DB2